MEVEIPQGEEELGEVKLKGLEACRIVPTVDKEGHVHFRSACEREPEAKKVQDTLERLYPGGEGVVFHKTKVIKQD